MRRFPFLVSKHALGLLVAVNIILLGTSIYLGLKSANQMREIVKEDFNQQQLVLAQHTASLLEQDINFLKRELGLSTSPPPSSTWRPSAGPTACGPPWAACGRKEWWRSCASDQDGNRAYLVDRPGAGPRGHRLLQRRAVSGMGRQPGKQGPDPGTAGVHPGPQLHRPASSLVMAMPTYEDSVDESHPHPSGDWSGVLVFYIDAQQLANKFTRQYQERQDRLCLDHEQPGHLSQPTRSATLWGKMPSPCARSACRPSPSTPSTRSSGRRC